MADDLSVTAAGVLIASGGVEVLYGETRMTAEVVAYDRQADRLQLEGPIIIADGDRLVVAASEADIDPGLRNGLLRGARLVLDRQLQLAAARIDRVDGRYSQLSSVAVTSCRVCGRTPLWSIRARRVVHDEEERQIYFEGAQFRIYDFPVLWLPRLRLPDPSLERATGFLIPQIRSSTELGVGLKTPYFIALGPARDLTVTPYLSTNTRTLELRYRQAFRGGDLQVDAGISRDDIRPGLTRGYAVARGVFVLPRDFDLTFDLEAVTDEDYLIDYGISARDRIDSRIDLTAVGTDRLTNVSLTQLEYLRDGTDNATEPSIVASLDWQRRVQNLAGGRLTFGFSADALYRYSDVDGPGRDVARLGVYGNWQRSHVTASGLVIDGQTALAVDHYRIFQDSGLDTPQSRVTPAAALTFRFPLARQERSGAVQTLEPVVMLAWSDPSAAALPNEDSTQNTFDEASLTRLFRFPGQDAVEHGARANIGLTWSRIDPEGWSARITLGRIYRAEDGQLFSASSGLAGETSDWLLAAALDIAPGLRLANRAVFDDGFDITAMQTAFRFDSTGLSLGAGHIWTVADAASGRPDPISEWSLDGRYRLNDVWEVAGDVRYDLAADRAAEAGLGLVYTNECVEIDLSVSRRYITSTSLTPTTDFGLSVALRGFSAGRQAGGPTGSCRQ